MFRKLRDIILNYVYKHIKAIERKENVIKMNTLIKSFKQAGNQFKISKDYSILNPQYISVGDKFSASVRFRMEAIDKYENQKFKPEIRIGNNVYFNTDIHIGCIDKIEIGDDCLFASRIYITDHDHGDTTYQSLQYPPAKRKLISKGPVIIKNNVWVGEGVAILSGVTIGENAIIATNSVVTKDVPPNSVVGGIPARVIKTITK